MKILELYYQLLTSIYPPYLIFKCFFNCFKVWLITGVCKHFNMFYVSFFIDNKCSTLCSIKVIEFTRYKNIKNNIVNCYYLFIKIT